MTQTQQQHASLSAPQLQTPWDGFQEKSRRRGLLAGVHTHSYNDSKNTEKPLKPRRVIADLFILAISILSDYFGLIDLRFEEVRSLLVLLRTRLHRLASATQNTKNQRRSTGQHRNFGYSDDIGQFCSLLNQTNEAITIRLDISASGRQLASGSKACHQPLGFVDIVSGLLKFFSGDLQTFFSTFEFLFQKSHTAIKGSNFCLSL